MDEIVPIIRWGQDDGDDGNVMPHALLRLHVLVCSLKRRTRRSDIKCQLILRTVDRRNIQPSQPTSRSLKVNPQTSTMVSAKLLALFLLTFLTSAQEQGISDAATSPEPTTDIPAASSAASLAASSAAASVVSSVLSVSSASEASRASASPSASHTGAAGHVGKRGV